MKHFVILFLLHLTVAMSSNAQQFSPDNNQRKKISFLIDAYADARERSDTALLKTILTPDVDQLVSSGEWRKGISTAVQGMLKSSANRPGKRTLSIYNIRMLDPSCAIVDCRYEIENTDGTTRKMWSTFIVVYKKELWKISAIRNMLPG